MLPGHTKLRPDSYFGLFKKHYRRQDHIDDTADIVECVRKSGQDVECVPQLYQEWEYYDWNTFLGQWFEPLSAFGHSHTFEFDREHPSVLEMRAMPSDTNLTKVNMLRRGVKVEDIRNAFQSHIMPPVIKPKGLSHQRSQYLFDKVREYVHDPTKRDNMCPKPQGVTAASSAVAPLSSQESVSCRDPQLLSLTLPLVGMTMFSCLRIHMQTTVVLAL